MDKVEHLVQQLESPSKDERYEACQSLKVTSCLPPEALKALEAHTNDPDKQVAEAARQAIAIQSQTDKAAIEEKPAAVEPVRASHKLAIAAMLIPGVLSAAPVVLWMGIGLLSLPLYWIWGNGPVMLLQRLQDFLLPPANSGWTLLYVVGALLGAVALVLGLRAQADRVDKTRRNAGWAGIILGCTGLFGQILLLFASNQY